MDPLATNFEDQKSEIELALARTVYTQLEKEEFDYEQAREVAGFILDNLDEVTNQQQLLLFLESLALKWSVFESLKGLMRLKITDTSQTAAKLEEAKEKLSQMSSTGA